MEVQLEAGRYMQNMLWSCLSVLVSMIRVGLVSAMVSRMGFPSSHCKQLLACLSRWIFVLEGRSHMGCAAWHSTCYKASIALQNFFVNHQSSLRACLCRYSRVQGPLLASDMSAFKAANPGAVLEDFVRWRCSSEGQQRLLPDGGAGNSSVARLCEPVSLMATHCCL